MCAQVSRDAPQPLPGDYTVGDKVFYKGASSKYPSGRDKLMYGQQGEVVGPATAESYKGKGVGVRFPGTTLGIVQCLLTKVSRRLPAASAASPPPAAPHTRRCPQATCVPATASAAASQPSLHEQPLAPKPNAQRRSVGRVLVRASGF